MDVVEKRARELLASFMRGKGWAGEFAAEVLQDRPADVRISGADAIEALVAALTPPEGYVLVPAELPDMGEAPGFIEGHYNRSNWQAAIDDLRWLAARPEVP